MPFHDSVPPSGASFGDQSGTGGVPGPLRRFADRLDEVRSADVLDMDQVGRVLAELAADDEFFGPLIAQLPAGSPGSRWLIRPERGPRLVLVHRPEGVMGYTHSHRCWVGIAPVRGVETHQRWDAVSHEDGRADLRQGSFRFRRGGCRNVMRPVAAGHAHGLHVRLRGRGRRIGIMDDTLGIGPFVDLSAGGERGGCGREGQEKNGTRHRESPAPVGRRRL